MLGPEIEEYRQKQKLDRRQFVKKVKPFLEGYSLDEQMLKRIESGAVSNADRVDDVVQAIYKAFPRVETKIVEKTLPFWRNKRLIRLAIIAFVLVLTVLTTILFVVFQEHPWIKNFMYGIGVFTALATAAGLLAAILFREKK